MNSSREVEELEEANDSVRLGGADATLSISKDGINALMTVCCTYVQYLREAIILILMSWSMGR